MALKCLEAKDEEVLQCRKQDSLLTRETLPFRWFSCWDVLLSLPNGMTPGSFLGEFLMFLNRQEEKSWDQTCRAMLERYVFVLWCLVLVLFASCWWLSFKQGVGSMGFARNKAMEEAR